MNSKRAFELVYASEARAVVFGAEWEFRFGPNNRFCVSYEVDRDAGAVYILSIGVKVQDRLYIGGEEVEL
jgi:hypothetical protein